jgi:hypothetical protein
MDKDDLVCDNLRERLKAKGLSLPQIKSGGRGRHVAERNARGFLPVIIFKPLHLPHTILSSRPREGLGAS